MRNILAVGRNYILRKTLPLARGSLCEEEVTGFPWWYLEPSHICNVSAGWLAVVIMVTNWAVQTPMQRNRMAAVARAFVDDQLLIGRSTAYRYTTYVLDSQHNTLQISGSYDILVVDDACSTAWVPYSAREPISVRAVVAGQDKLFRARYIFRSKKF